jgi:nickel transport protein
MNGDGLKEETFRLVWTLFGKTRYPKEKFEGILMKSLVRLGATLGLVGGILLGGLPAMENLRAIALPEDQVVKKLAEVPVFTLTNAQGDFVVRSIKNENQTVSQVGFFVSKQDAQKFLDDRLKKENPQLANTMKVVAVSLGDFYTMAQASKKKPDGTVFTLVPAQQQVELARTLLTQSGQQGQQFNGIPLFVPKFKKDNNYLTIPLGNERFIPFYFDKQQAVALIDRFKQAVPAEAANTEIQVVDLQSVIQTLLTSNDPGLSKIVLYPSQESIQFIRTLQPASGQNQAQPARPQQQQPARPQQPRR